MLKEHIKKDSLVKLYRTKQLLEDYENEEKLLVCRGRVAQIVSDSEMEILIDASEEENLQKNICYILYLFLPQEVLMCSCYFMSAYAEGEQKNVTLDLVSALEFVQRRMHQRVSCHSRIFYQEIEKEELKSMAEHVEIFDELREQREFYEESLIDISGGGVRFVSKKKLAVDSYVSVCFEIVNEKRAVEMKVTGQVVYAMPLRNEQDSYDIRVKYIGLAEEQREKIIHFVFQLERDSINTRWQRGGKTA